LKTHWWIKQKSTTIMLLMTYNDTRVCVYVGEIEKIREREIPIIEAMWNPE
jgi:hypothetical protein